MLKHVHIHAECNVYQRAAAAAAYQTGPVLLRADAQMSDERLHYVKVFLIILC